MAEVGERRRRVFWAFSVPMTILAPTCVYPIYFFLDNALKNNNAYILDRFGMVSNPTLLNFAQAWTRSRLSEYFFNSVITTGGAVVVLILVSSLAGFSLACLRFPFRRFIFVPILAAPMIPVQVVLVPFYRTVITLGILNTLYCWNDALISPLVLQRERTPMVGIAASRGECTTNVPLPCAGTALAAAPIVVLHVIFQRRIVSGIAVGAVKG